MFRPAPRLSLVSFAAAALVIVGACGGNDDGGARAAVSAADGGTVSSADGALTLEIPAGTLARDTEIAIERVPSEELDQEIRDAAPVGPVYRLTADGLDLEEPVKLIFALSADDVLAGVSENEYPAFLVLSRSDDGEWDIAREVVTTYDFETGAVTVEAEVFHFSTFMTRYSPDIRLSFDPESIDTDVGFAWGASLDIDNRGPRVFLLGERTPFASGVVSVVSGLDSRFRGNIISPGEFNTYSGYFGCDSAGEGGFGISNTVSIALDRAAAEELMFSLGGLTLGRALDVIILEVGGAGHATCSAEAVAPASPLTPTATAPPPTETASPTATAPPPAETAPPTATTPPPGETASPTATTPPPTETASPTATAPPPTETASPTATADGNRHRSHRVAAGNDLHD